MAHNRLPRNEVLGQRHALAGTAIDVALEYRQFYLAILYFRSPAAFLDESVGSICTITSVTRG
jgi:hypothetical protein